MNLLMISNSVSPSPASRSRLEGKGREGSAVQCVRGDGDGILKRCDVIWGGRISLLFSPLFLFISTLLLLPLLF